MEATEHTVVFKFTLSCSATEPGVPVAVAIPVEASAPEPVQLVLQDLLIPLTSPAPAEN